MRRIDVCRRKPPWKLFVTILACFLSPASSKLALSLLVRDVPSRGFKSCDASLYN